MAKEKTTEKGKRMTVEVGTDAVMQYISANPNRSDTDSIAKAINVSNATVKRYAEMLVFAGKLEKHTGRTYYSVA